MQIPTPIESILTALFSGEATDPEVNILREWLDASPEHHSLLEEYRQLNFILKSYSTNNTYDTDAAWKRVTDALYEKPSRRRAHHREQTLHTGEGSEFTFICGIKVNRNWMKQAGRYAAIFILAFGAGMAAIHYYPEAPEKEETDETAVFFTEYTVPYGSKSRIVLPDSSSIWMNAGSKLRYSSAFNRTEREVYIEGEAYFTVTRNEDKPFFVRTSAVTLKVLGTSFNVKAYPEEDNVETTVESGSVQVLRNVKGRLMDNLILTAGQKAMVIKASQSDSVQMAPPLPLPVRKAKTVLPEKGVEKTIVSQNISTELYTSWKDARWLIEKEKLESLAVKLERRYNIHISFEEESLRQFSFSGTLKDETLEQVLEVIKLSAPVNYTVHQNNVKLSVNKWITNDNKFD
jgi:ferric-dicitrate binding protein FerR (iron transport regulator)